MQFDLPNIQNQKVNFLLGRGGKIKSMKILVETPNGYCTIDDFGYVEWVIKKENFPLTEIP